MSSLRSLVRVGVVLLTAAVSSCGDNSPTGPSLGASTNRRLSVGEETACALDSGGALYCWGLNSTRFEYGVSPTAQGSSPAPVRLASPTFAALSVGPSQHMCGLTSDHLAYCWGRGGFGELGNGSAGASGNTYTQVLGNFWSTVSVNRLTTCGVTTLGTGLCWGVNQRGEVGTSAVAIPTQAFSPVPLETNVKFKRVVSGWLHACAITTADSVMCWGDNRAGQLGLGTTDTSAHTVPTPIASQEKFSDLSLGAMQTCGVTLDHRALCWGQNATGQLGDGTVESRATPTPVAGGLKFVAISVGSGFAGGTSVAAPVSSQAGGSAHTCAMAESGAPYCWGWNGAGQLGDGSTTDRRTPVAVSGGLSVTTIGAGGSSTCAMRGNAVWCWGSNRSGQLGNSSSSEISPNPISVSPPFDKP